MGSCNSLQTVDVVEFSGNFVPKEPACSTRTHCPSIDVFWVTPHQIAESALMRNFLSSGDDANLINSANFGTESTVYTKNCAIHDSGEYKEVEYLTARFPHRCVAILCLALLIESVDLSDLARLVIASYKYNSVGIPAIIISLVYSINAYKIYRLCF